MTEERAWNAWSNVAFKDARTADEAAASVRNGRIIDADRTGDTALSDSFEEATMAAYADMMFAPADSLNGVIAKVEALTREFEGADIPTRDVSRVLDDLRRLVCA